MRIIVSTILLVSMVLGLSILVPSSKPIDELLAPYQAVIDKVNKDLGTTIYIPDQNKEKLYNNLKNMRPEQVEALLRKEYMNLDDSSLLKFKDDYIVSIPKEATKQGPLPNASGPLHFMWLEE